LIVCLLVLSRWVLPGGFFIRCVKSVCADTFYLLGRFLVDIAFGAFTLQCAGGLIQYQPYFGFGGMSASLTHLCHTRDTPRRFLTFFG
jgi:hypothetical protein